MLFYICDRKKNCAGSPGCKNNGGDCIHCVDPEHAKYGAINDEPYNHRDRFEPENFDIGNGKIVTYFWEYETAISEEENDGTNDI